MEGLADIPLELIGAIFSGLLGFGAKALSISQNNMKEMLELQIKSQMTGDQLANSAAKRSSPVARKVLAFLFIGIVMGGLLFVGIASIWNDNAVVSLVTDAPQKSILWGFIKWGGGQVVTVAHGFVLPPWVSWVVSVIVGFFFGSGVAKTK